MPAQFSWDYYAAGGRRVVSRKKEEFMANFCLIAKRTLTDLKSLVFRYYFLLGADWKLCVGQMKIDRGLFFHTVYRVEEKLGRAFVEMEPNALYPLDEYFGPPIPGPFYRLHLRSGSGEGGRRC